MAGIEIQDVVKGYGGGSTLKGVSLTVGRGEFVALVGPSGCGKSTLLKLLAGIDEPDSGRIRIDGRDVTGLRPGQRDVAMVFQSYALYPHLTVAENVAVPLAMRRLNGWQRLPYIGAHLPGSAAARAGIDRDVGAAAAALGLAHLLDRRPGQLSGGQRQRVALARAIVRQPAAFLMDEPLSNLDAALRVQTRREIVDIHRRAGAATLYVTHDQAEALTMADRVAVMQEGRILQVAPPQAIYADPQDLRVATFIGSPRINTLPVEADAEGVVRLAGQVLGLRAPVPGRLTLAIRPEDLQLGGAGGIPVLAQGLEFLGESLLLHLRHEPSNTALVLRAAPEQRPAFTPGEALSLRLDPRRALLFGAEGQRLPAALLAAEPELV